MSMPEIAGLRITNAPELRGHAIRAEAKTVEKPAVCSHCGEGPLHRHGASEKTVADAPLRGWVVEIAIQCQRYKCQRCGKTTAAPISGVHLNRALTERFFEELGEATLRRTFADVASQYHVDESTLGFICREYAQRLERKVQFDVPEVLGISAVTYQNETHALLVDIGQGAPYDLLESPTPKELEKYLDAMWDPDIDEAIHTVVIDANDTYRACVEAVLPESYIVLAPATLRELAYSCAHKVRQEIYRHATRTQRTRIAWADEFLKKPRNMLSVAQKAKHDLLASPAENDQGLRRITTAYDKCEDLAEIYEAKNRRLAETKARQWLHSMPAELASDFEPLQEALRTWWDPILDWHIAEVTETELDSLRGLLDGINARGRGYSFEILRAKLLFYPPKRSPQPLLTQQPSGQPMMGYTTTLQTSVNPVQRPTHRGPRIVDLLEHMDAITGSRVDDEK